MSTLIARDSGALLSATDSPVQTGHASSLARREARADGELLGPDRATGRCYLDLRSVKQQMEFLGAGHYVDTYVKVRGQWRFARRLFTALRFDESPVAASAKSPSRRQARR